jgi:hypothetical protein
MNLRPRQIEKELAGNFKFKPRNYFEKFKDHIDNKNPSNTIQSTEHYSKSIINKRTGTLRKGLNPVTPILKKFPTTLTPIKPSSDY